MRLILVLVAVVVIVILALLGPAIGNVFSNIVRTHLVAAGEGAICLAARPRHGSPILDRAPLSVRGSGKRQVGRRRRVRLTIIVQTVSYRRRPEPSSTVRV